MSTILDALKKSEQERKLKNIPRLSDMPAPHEPSRWPWIVVGMIVMLSVAVLVYLMTLMTFDRPVVNNESAVVADVPVMNDERFVVNVISYSDDVDKRFVIIDGKMLRETEFIEAGVKVDKIEADQVTLIIRGERVMRRP